MLYQTIFSFALFGAAFANPIAKRDLATIQQGVGSVSTALQQLDTAVKAVQAPADAMQLVTASNQVNTAITTATTQITGTQAISLTDAVTLQTTAQGLSTQAMTTVMDVIAKKAIIQQAGQTQAILQALMSQKTAATALANAVTMKVPTGVQNIAKQQTGMIGAALDMGIQAFGGTAAAAPPA